MFRTRVRFPPAPPVRALSERTNTLNKASGRTGVQLSVLSNGADQAIDGVISIEMDNTVGDDRKSSKTLKRK